MKNSPFNRAKIKQGADRKGNLKPSHLGTDCANEMQKDGLIKIIRVAGMNWQRLNK